MRKVSQSVAFTTERVDTSGGRIWVALDSAFEIVEEVRDFALYLQSAGKAENTLRQYVPRVTTFLNWCSENNVVWRSVNLAQMARFKWFIESEPISGGRTRTARSVNIFITAIVEFLRFCARAGTIDREVAAALSEQRYISHGSDRFDPGEGGAFRNVRASVLKSREMVRPPHALDEEEWKAIQAACRTTRDTFLVQLLLDTGLRIGEALGLRRSDLHFLATATSLGCRVVGPHVHVERRADNINKMFAKSINPRVVPASEQVIASYAAYQADKSTIAGAQDTDYVFVNLYNGQVGSPMTYSAASKVFNRLRRDSGVEFAPHALRHTAATNWLHAGKAELDTVQALLGHASSSSTMVYLHPSDAEKRDAVDRVAAELGGDER